MTRSLPPLVGQLDPRALPDCPDPLGDEQVDPCR